MLTGDPNPSSKEQRLQAILVAYLEAAERGLAPPSSELQARHPEFAVELAEFLANQARLDQLAAPLRAVAGAATHPGRPDDEESRETDPKPRGAHGGRVPHARPEG